MNAKAVETRTLHSKFMRKVGENWDLVKGRLCVTLGDWKEDTFEEQRRHLANQTSPPMTPGQAKELAREINKLLFISEWRVQDRSSASPTPAHSLVRLHLLATLPASPCAPCFKFIVRGGARFLVPPAFCWEQTWL